MGKPAKFLCTLMFMSCQTQPIFFADVFVHLYSALTFIRVFRGNCVQLCRANVPSPPPSPPLPHISYFLIETGKNISQLEISNKALDEQKYCFL